VTESALQLARALRHVGSSTIYAAHRDERLSVHVRRLDEFDQSGTADDIFVVHVSIGEPAFFDFVLRRPERVVLVYHNVTPAAFFEEFDPAFASLLRSARHALPQLARRSIGAVADSEYNAAELRAIGLHNVEVAPPALNLARLTAAESDPNYVRELGRVPGPNILCVGQLLPHKRPDLAIDALHLLNVNYSPQARLILTGPPRNAVYAHAVNNHVASLNLKTVWMAGEVGDPGLAALYRGCDLLLLPSEHEGFGVPLVEALHFGLPIVTRDFGAIRETVGEAGVVLPASAAAAELCEAMARVLRDDALREGLKQRAVERAARFSPEATLAASLKALRTVLRNANAPSHAQ
jgi:glycosyltransferase involved in cell wall biosynthesis